VVANKALCGLGTFWTCFGVLCHTKSIHSTSHLKTHVFPDYFAFLITDLVLFGVFVQDEFCGFTDDDIRRVSKRTSVVEGLRENLLKSVEPASSVRSRQANRHRILTTKPVSPLRRSPEVALSPLPSPPSDSCSPRGSLKGNIKVKLLLGRYKLLPTPNNKQVIHNNAAVKEPRKRQRKLSGNSQLDDSPVSSSEESEVKYSLLVDKVFGGQRRGRPCAKPTALVQARARKLVSKARGGLPVEKKAAGEAAVKSWTPCWHGRMQLPTQSSRSSRKITINRRFLDDSYSSIGQPGLADNEKSGAQSARDLDTEVERAGGQARPGSRMRAVGLLNRPIGALSHWRRHLQSHDKATPEHLSRARRTKSVHPVGEKENATDSVNDDEDNIKLSDLATAQRLGSPEAPWIKNAQKSVFSIQTKKGSMVGRHCYICSKTYLVLHHYMCRVPVCRSCARFYKGHCERGTQLDQLTCVDEGMYCRNFK